MPLPFGTASNLMTNLEEDIMIENTNIWDEIAQDLLHLEHTLQLTWQGEQVRLVRDKLKKLLQFKIQSMMRKRHKLTDNFLVVVEIMTLILGSEQKQGNEILKWDTEGDVDLLKQLKI